MSNNQKELDPKYVGKIVRAIRNDDVDNLKSLLNGHLEYLDYDNKSQGTYIYSCMEGSYRMHEVSSKSWGRY